MQFVAVVGPTASGKSEVALQLAEAVGGEIVCCDSVQLYQGFNIGAASPTKNDLERAPHHLFGTFNWDEPCDAGVYVSKASQSISAISSRGRVPIVTGGTGLYLRALQGDKWEADLPKDESLREELRLRSSSELYEHLQKLDPRRASELHPNDRFRVVRALEIVIISGKPVPISSPLVGSANQSQLIVNMNPPRAVLHKNIAVRTRKMLDEGLLGEVKDLINSGVTSACKPMQSIGYFEAAKYLSGEIQEKDLYELILAATRQYAKRQCTWFKKLKADYELENSNGLIGNLPSITADIARLRSRAV